VAVFDAYAKLSETDILFSAVNGIYFRDVEDCFPDMEITDGEYKPLSPEDLDFPHSSVLMNNGKISKKTFVRTSKKVGRNDPCACGSEKKHKKCCGSLDARALNLTKMSKNENPTLADSLNFIGEAKDILNDAIVDMEVEKFWAPPKGMK
jgi:hypothetical protein